MGSFTDLKVWQLAKELAVETYQIVGSSALVRDYGLKDQMQRAAVSIASNIAEGEEFGHTKKAVFFFHTARGSVAELITQTIIAKEAGLITNEQSESIQQKAHAISMMLRNLIVFRSKNFQR
jgi:four helix bundle protein